VTSYEIEIHLRESVEPTRIALPGVSEEDAEADRQQLLHELDEARLVEVPVLAVQTTSGFPVEPLAVDPQDVTAVNLVESPADDH
jgi:hypothetical protein